MQKYYIEGGILVEGVYKRVKSRGWGVYDRTRMVCGRGAFVGLLVKDGEFLGIEVVEHLRNLGRCVTPPNVHVTTWFAIPDLKDNGVSDSVIAVKKCRNVHRGTML